MTGSKKALEQLQSFQSNGGGLHIFVAEKENAIKYEIPLCRLFFHKRLYSL